MMAGAQPASSGGGSSGFMSVLLSPPVIFAGVAVGAVLLIAGRSAGAPAATASSSNASAGVQEAQIGATVQMNQAAMANQVALAQVAASSGAAQLNANVQEQGQIIGLVENMNNNTALITNTALMSAAGVTNTSLTTSANVAMDISNNQARLAQAYVSANVAEHVSDNNLTATYYQTQAAQKISSNQMLSSIIGSAFNFGGKLVTGGGF